MTDEQHYTFYLNDDAMRANQTRKIEELEGEIARLTGERDALRLERDQAQQQLMDAEFDVQHLHGDIAHLTGELAAAQLANGSLCENINQLQAELAAAKAERDALAAKNLAMMQAAAEEGIVFIGLNKPGEVKNE